jgi:hemoglobin-like flavoprotein
MTSEQIAIVRKTWARIAPVTDRVAALFYERLFELDPGARGLFGTTDLRDHGRKLTQRLAAILDLLDRPDELLTAVGELGRRHAMHGVGWRHYGMAADALFTALECCLGPGFNPDARAAWSLAYWTVARAMQRAAAQVA